MLDETRVQEVSRPPISKRSLVQENGPQAEMYSYEQGKGSPPWPCLHLQRRGQAIKVDSH